MSVDVLLTSTVLTSVLVSSSLLQPEKQIVVNKIRKNATFVTIMLHISYVWMKHLNK